ncbi:hypothetical protein KSP39_PZI015965 [Platanthera zijinensis]|uniref:Transposase n=1 Tax=Platanthera zijinensis TaxID=2320716 RepID=A0AAP0BB46_9ASPA
MVRLLQGKTMHGWTDVSFTWLLESLIDAFPNINLPKSYYEAQKITKDLGFSYETLDACPKNCMLFNGNDLSLDECEICGESRYKKYNESSGIIQCTTTKIASKQVRYFPLKLRLKRLFMSSKNAHFMRWHTDERTDDGIMRNPTDTP